MLIHSYKRNKQEEATLLLKDQKSYAAEHHLEDDKSGFYQVDGRPHDQKFVVFFCKLFVPMRVSARVSM